MWYFALINNNNSKETIEKYQKRRKSRPEFSILKDYNNVLLGFHRLAINGLNDESNQPIIIDNIILICNGEIYNYKQLAKDHNILMKTQSDCEIIIHMYKLYGIEYTLNILDGVYAFVIYDKNTNNIIAARDPYGVRPLYYYTEKNTIGFASELKEIYNLLVNKCNINNFKPGYYSIFAINSNNSIDLKLVKYNNFSFINQPYLCENMNNLYSAIYDKIHKSVRKRVIETTERPVACLLSGGLDSSLIAALVNKELQNDNNETRRKNNKYFSIGLEGSEDLKYAKIVAQQLNSNHHEIVVSEEDFFNAIPEVIRAIESYDTTTTEQV